MQVAGGGDDGFDVVPGALKALAWQWDDDAKDLDAARADLASLGCTAGIGPRVVGAFTQFIEAWDNECEQMAAWSRDTGDRLRACAGAYGAVDFQTQASLQGVLGWLTKPRPWDWPARLDEGWQGGQP